MAAEYAHTMIRVGNPQSVIDFYREAFDWKLKREIENDTFTLYFIGPPGQKAEIELTYNHGEDEPYEKSRGFGHIAVRSQDNRSLRDSYEAALDAGGEDYRPPEECPGNYAFVKDPEGFEVEIID